MRTNFVRLTTALASRFQPENQAEMYRAQMKSKIRGRTEQIPVLGQDIKRLVRLAYPSAPMEVRDYLARDCFIDSLNDADMEWAIFQAKAKNIDNAIQVALEIPVTGLSVWQPKSQRWAAMHHSSDGFWLMGPGVFEKPVHPSAHTPLKMKLTAANGVVIEDQITQMANEVVIHGTGKQFPLDPSLPRP
ncbi:unnamed protein product [Mytilus edulis]|uniref:Uncharacterized protein n=1 Tax=Mytilus edulis TaxID=6550 RepID=A0A8S3Q185_MYTED|nr:unnamed protein product [Mytilus edulis]